MYVDWRHGEPLEGYRTVWKDVELEKHEAV
jgi:hypothetical protein